MKIFFGEFNMVSFKICKLSCNTIRVVFIKVISAVVDPKELGVKTLRSEVASAAANNDIRDRLIGKQDWWTSITRRKKSKATSALGLQIFILHTYLPLFFETVVTESKQVSGKLWLFSVLYHLEKKKREEAIFPAFTKKLEMEFLFGSAQGVFFSRRRRIKYKWPPKCYTF